ncbi:helix-turn-helix transcriptional regulator [bacterium]|nr:helix-turn-helix transcriptional regulator [bacterium]
MRLKRLFGKHLKSIRESHGLTQQEFAELVNMQPNSIGQIEIGYKAVSFSTLERFSEKLNMDYKEFFDFEGVTQNENYLSEALASELRNLDAESQKFVLSSVKNMVKFIKNRNI